MTGGLIDRELLGACDEMNRREIRNVRVDIYVYTAYVLSRLCCKSNVSLVGLIAASFGLSAAIGCRRIVSVDFLPFLVDYL